MLVSGYLWANGHTLGISGLGTAHDGQCGANLNLSREAILALLLMDKILHYPL